MLARLDAWVVVALQVTEQWRRPPAGTLRRGWIWVRSPRVFTVVAVLAVFAVLLTIVASIRQKWRRR